MPFFILPIPYANVDCAVVHVNCESRVFAVAVVRFAYVDDKIIVDQLNWGFNRVLLGQALKIFLIKELLQRVTNLGKSEEPADRLFILVSRIFTGPFL